MAKKDEKKREKNGAKRQPPLSRLARHQPFYERILFVVALLGVLVTLHLNVWYGAATVPSDDRYACHKQAFEAGVSGVPAVLINGRFITSASRPEACLSQFIEEALRNDEPGG